MLFGYEATEVFLDAPDERPLSASRDDAYLPALLFDALHEFGYALHDGRFGQTGKDLCLAVVYFLCLLLADCGASLLLADLYDGVGAFLSFGEVGIDSSHFESDLIHCLYPCRGMVWHTVVENAVHVEQEELRQEPVAALLLFVVGDEGWAHEGKDPTP